jgi:uncharacterized iron-regulated membrane protein
MSPYLWSLFGCAACFGITPAIVLWMDRRQAARALRQYAAIVALVFVLPAALGASVALLI